MPKKSHATLTNPDELLDSPLANQLDEGPEPDEPQDTPTQTPPPEPEQLAQLPIALALPQQTRRVREQVLPAWYALRYAGPGQNDPAVADNIMTMNAALTTAEQAMMTQDVALMIFAYRALERFQV